MLTRAVLGEAGIDCEICADLRCVTRELERGAGALLLAEEAIASGAEPLAGIIARQPPWADLPILVLAHRGADSPSVTEAVHTLGNVTLLERPIRVAALASAVRSALRARDRQYRTRAHLLERDRAARALEEADRRKDEFLATLAHELRNPLAPIRNSAPDPAASPLRRSLPPTSTGSWSDRSTTWCDWSTTCSKSPASPAARSSSERSGWSCPQSSGPRSRPAGR